MDVYEEYYIIFFLLFQWYKTTIWKHYISRKQINRSHEHVLLDTEEMRDELIGDNREGHKGLPTGHDHHWQ